MDVVIIYFTKAFDQVPHTHLASTIMVYKVKHTGWWSTPGERLRSLLVPAVHGYLPDCLQMTLSSKTYPEQQGLPIATR